MGPAAPIYVATKNPAKLEGVRRAFEREPIAHPVESGVARQPSSFDEIVRGAEQRAASVRDEVDDAKAYYVGIESGYHAFEGRKIQMTIAVVLCGGSSGIGSSQSYTLPRELAKRIPRLELKEAEREAYGHDLSRAGGIISILTDSAMTRAELVRQATQMALLSLEGDDRIRAYMEGL